MSETEILNWKAKNNWERFKAVVEEIVAPRNGLNYISHADKQRLLILDSWAIKYKLPLEWIVEHLLRYYGFRNGRWMMKGRGLPVRITTLISAASEDALKEIIAREFPDGEHLEVWRQQQQEMILESILSKPQRMKTVMEFSTRREYDNWYRKQIEQRREQEERLLVQLRKSRPYRGNPFR